MYPAPADSAGAIAGVTEYTSNATFEDVAARICRASSIALATHSKPDGDALGSVLALARALRSRGKTVRAMLMGPIPPGLRALIGPTVVEIIDQPPHDFEPDVVIIADTGALSQLEPLGGWLASRLERTIVLDHHVNGDVAASQRIIDPARASASRVIFDLLGALEIEITGGPFGIAEALFLGLATDTGWFRFSNADADAFRTAAALIEAGADKGRIHRLVEENDRPQRFAITARALQSLEFVAQGQAAVMLIRPEDFAETGATTEDTVGIVNEPLAIGAVRMSCLCSATTADETKLSFRSKPAFETEAGIVPPIDVNRLASTFGGGGHIHAAGARLALPVNAARAKVIDAIDRFLAG